MTALGGGGCTQENRENWKPRTSKHKGRDFKTQGQSKIKENQDQILEEPEHFNLFQTYVTPMWEDAHKRTQEVEVSQEVQREGEVGLLTWEASPNR